MILDFASFKISWIQFDPYRPRRIQLGKKSFQENGLCSTDGYDGESRSIRVRKELETTYLHSIISIIEDNKIPKPMVINLDQTPSKYVPCCNKTLATKGIKSVSDVGSTDKRTITATFSITMDGTFLPMQIIYSEKTSKNIPPVSFPSASR